MVSLPIALPHGFIPLVKIGDTIYRDTILAEKSSEKEEIINLSLELGLPPEKVRKIVKKNPGDKVSPGDVLAYKKGVLGIKSEFIQSEVSGTILRFDRSTGTLVIRLTADNHHLPKTTIISPIDGVVSLCNNEKIVIDTEKHVIVGHSGRGKTTQADLVILKEEPRGSQIKLHQIDASLAGKIILSFSFSRDALVKAIGVDVLGIIAVAIDQEDYQHLAQRDIMTPVVGIDAQDYERLVQHTDKAILIDGVAKSIILL